MSKKTFFIVTPKKPLLELFTLYSPKDNNLSKEHIWEMYESSDYIENRELFYGNYVKISLLLYIIQQYSHSTIQKRFPIFIKIVQEMFGDPPDFDINKLDEWWTFQRIGRYKNFNDIVKRSESSHFSQIEKTGDSSIDEWLESRFNMKK